MKIQPPLAIALATLLIISNTLSVCAGSTDRLPQVTASPQNNSIIPVDSPPKEWESVTSGDHFPSYGDTSEQDPSGNETDGSDMTAPDEAPMFNAYIEHSPQGYVVKGTFTEFLPGTCLIRPLYSLDGETWQFCQTTWNLQWLDIEATDRLKQLQNQTCLYNTHEPLADYLAGRLDHFYLKLQITLENGIAYETQAALIDRGAPQPLPEEFQPVASFVPAMLIRQWRPFKRYGQYQITVSAAATPEDISALLPDRLPIEVQLYAGINIVTSAVVDCPVTWKPLSLSRLNAGESVTITDAAEEIIVPAGTLLNTPNGIFQLNKPLDIDHDEIRLVLNVVAENTDPTGALACEIDGLQIAFHLKPTGATAIRTYTLSENGTDWVELPDSLLPEEVNTPSSAAGSTYTYVLKNTSEPYQTYLAAWNVGAEPSPFFVGLLIEGGVYDGRQLILAWPGTYEFPAKLPSLKGSGGNEGNAGSDDKNDSTSDGQRPGLPQEPEDKPAEQKPMPTQEPKDDPDKPDPKPTPPPQDKQDSSKPKPALPSKDEQDTQKPKPTQSPQDDQGTQAVKPAQEPKEEQDAQETEPSQDLKDEQNAPKPKPTQNPEDEQDAQGTKPAQEPKDEQDAQETKPAQNPKEEQDAQETEPPQIPAEKPALSQPPKYRPETQQHTSSIPEVQLEKQPDLSQTSKDQSLELSQVLEEKPKERTAEQFWPAKDDTVGHTAGTKDFFLRDSMAEMQPSQLTGTEKPSSVPASNTKADSPTLIEANRGAEHNIHRLLLLVSAAIAIGICIIAAGKVMAGSMSGKISRKIMRAIYRLLHLK